MSNKNADKQLFLMSFLHISADLFAPVAIVLVLNQSGREPPHLKFSNCSQAFAVTSGSVAANATITISNTSATILGTLTMAPVSYNNGTILVSAPGMTNGGSYTLNVGSSSAAISGVTTYNTGGMGGGLPPRGTF